MALTRAVWARGLVVDKDSAAPKSKHFGQEDTRIIVKIQRRHMMK